MLSKLFPAFLIASAGWGGIVTDVGTAMSQGNFPLAQALVSKYRSQYGVTPEMIEALSWLGRGELANRQLDKADAYAKQTEALVGEQLKKRALDSDPHLATALGAAIEVQGLVLNGRGERGEAIEYLQMELAAYRTTSIGTRIQKNINLLGLEGKLAPALDEREFLGSKPLPLAALRGKPVVLFFWAHWCGDCKQEEPILAKLAKEYSAKGLVVIAPTQRYGYVARGEEAGPAAELKYIDEIRHQFYADFLNAPAPISELNFKRYGASTTPTLVFIDRRGIVRLYHPGAMTEDELRAALKRIS